MSQIDSPTEMVQLKEGQKDKKKKQRKLTKLTNFFTREERETFKQFIHTNNLIIGVVLLIFLSRSSSESYPWFVHKCFLIT